MKLVVYGESEKMEEQYISKDGQKNKTVLDDIEMLEKNKNQQGHGMGSLRQRNSREIIMDESNLGQILKQTSQLKRRDSTGRGKEPSENNSYNREAQNEKIK